MSYRIVVNFACFVPFSGKKDGLKVRCENVKLFFREP
jgi:hypothetical protein